MSDSSLILKPCPFCGATDLKPGDTSFVHPRNDCILSATRFLLNDETAACWNSARPTPDTSALRKFVESIVDTAGPYPHLNGEQIIVDAYAALRAHPSEDSDKEQPMAYNRVPTADELRQKQREADAPKVSNSTGLESGDEQPDDLLIACPFCGGSVAVAPRDAKSIVPWIISCCANMVGSNRQELISRWNTRNPPIVDCAAATSGYLQVAPVTATLEWSDDNDMGVEKAVKKSRELEETGTAPEAAGLEPACDPPTPATQQPVGCLVLGQLGLPCWKMPDGTYRPLEEKEIDYINAALKRESVAPLKAVIRSLSGAIDALRDIVRGESLEHDFSEIVYIINRAQDEARAVLERGS